jgi:glutathione synthase/RimK-type ligase-like ATP-grasp enzyme
MRILLSEGSGLTSRQVAGRLGALGHEVEILSSTQICLTRFTRHVRAVHLVPHFGRDPFGWFDAAARIAKERRAELLFPTQEQVTVLSARRRRLGVATLVPPFASLKRVQDKISAFRALQALGAPQPGTIVIASADDLAQVKNFPAFVKRPVSTASSGVVRVKGTDELAAAARDLGLGTNELIVQTQVDGPLAMVQAVADRGRLIAHHACLRVREGVGGGASLKESVILPEIPSLLEKLVAALEWHGGLSMDVIVTSDGPVVIDVNPRLVEPANALAAGVDLVAAMLDLCGKAPAPVQPGGRAGVRTHQTLIALLGAAEQKGKRGAVLREALDAMFSRGAYAGSNEELSPLGGDPIAAIPVAVALAATLVRPALWKKFHTGAVGPYAVTSEAWRDIVAAADEEISPLPTSL